MFVQRIAYHNCPRTDASYRKLVAGYNRGIRLHAARMIFIAFLRGSLTIAMENYSLLMLSGAIVLFILYFPLPFYSFSCSLSLCLCLSLSIMYKQHLAVSEMKSDIN